MWISCGAFSLKIVAENGDYNKKSSSSIFFVCVPDNLLGSPVPDGCTSVSSNTAAATALLVSVKYRIES